MQSFYLHDLILKNAKNPLNKIQKIDVRSWLHDKDYLLTYYGGKKKVLLKKESE